MLELSSFQLDGVARLRARRRGGAQPDAGPPRLARHDGRLRRRQGAHLRPARGDASLNRDDAAVDAAAAAAGAGADVQGPAAASRAPRGRASAPALPQRPGDFGLDVEQRHGLAGARARADDDAERRRDDAADEMHLQRLMPADALRIRGRHNAAQRAGRAGAGRAPSAARSRRCCTACANTAASRTASSIVASVDGVDVLRRQQGHQRRRDRRRARRPGRRPGAGQAASSSSAATARARTSRRWPRRSRRHARAVRADRPRRARRSRPRWPHAGVPLRALRDARGTRCAAARSAPSRRRGAAVAGLRQLRHVPQLRAPRRGLRRRGAGASAERDRAVVAVSAALRRRAPAAGGAAARAVASRGGGARRAAGAAARPARRAAEPMPVREWISVDPGQPARLLGFDQALVWVVVGLLALGLVMVYSASIALPDNPQVRALRADLLPHPPRAVAGASPSSRRWWPSRCRWRPGRSSAPWLFVAVAAAAGGGADAVHRQGRQRRAPLDPARHHELPAVRARQARDRALRRRLHGAQDGREGELLPRRAADGGRGRAWSACCCWPSPTWAPSW